MRWVTGEKGIFIFSKKNLCNDMELSVGGAIDPGKYDSVERCNCILGQLLVIERFSTDIIG